MLASGQTHHCERRFGEDASIGADFGILRVDYVGLRIVEPGIGHCQLRACQVAAGIYLEPLRGGAHVDIVHPVAERFSVNPDSCPLSGKDIIPHVGKHVVNAVAAHVDHGSGLSDGVKLASDGQACLVVE